MERVLVTGANGIIGAALRRLLLADDATTSVFAVHSPAIGESERAFDLRDGDSIRTLVSATRPDVVIHLAGLTGPGCEVSPQDAFQINVEGTRRLAMAALEEGVRRFVFASSAAVYGDLANRPAREDDPLAGRSVYARSKAEAEQALSEVALSSGAMSSISGRIFNVVDLNSRLSLFSRLFASAREGNDEVVLRGLDSFVRDYVRSIDVARGLLDLARIRPPRQNDVTNIGTGVATSNRMLIEMMTKRVAVRHRLDAKDLGSYSVADTSHFRALVGYELPPLPGLLASEAPMESLFRVDA
ncbi:NAD-dependent epimerase/dehydratase family protein [Leifsonia sp. YIM 134122]|uniref:NAD-dependent epimerase/dehydratase family protein n=1 Tax=Leifsonia stereocauli TaxID=3134136 RepID=A0ABU9W6I4_9MICO